MGFFQAVRQGPIVGKFGGIDESENKNSPKVELHSGSFLLWLNILF